jgi:hypothetical protein
LVGGSTRIPCIVKLVSDFVNSKEPDKSINPDELLPMVPQSKLSSFLVTPLRRLKTFSSSMLPLFPLVLRQLVVS